jgi:hypothetical protein
MLKESNERQSPCVVPNLRGKAFSYLLSSIKLVVDFPCRYSLRSSESVLYNFIIMKVSS